MKARILTIAWCLLSLTALSQETADALSRCDSVDVSLLTCEPHEAIYSLYGHTAIRIQDHRTGEDMVVNYGVFDSSKPYFYLRFAFGLTDYCVGVVPFEYFRYEYGSYGCGVTQQVLRLTPSEKLRFLTALHENLLPENVEYRYNYFYDNCTTRARDIILGSMERPVVAPAPADSVKSYRQLIHDYNGHHPWPRWANDILLGWPSDFNTTHEQRQFLPRNLMVDFDQLQVRDSDGVMRPFVERKFLVLQPEEQPIGNEFPLRPHTCALLILAATVAVTVAEVLTRRWLWGYDMLLMLLSGLCGIVLFAMLFSSHPTVNQNLQLLLFNPLPLLLLWPVARRALRHESHWWRTAQLVLVALFLAGSLVQDYAEGMLTLSLCYLIRCVSAVWQCRHNRR